MVQVYLIILSLIFMISGCSAPSSVKRGGLAPEVSSKFDPEGHLGPESSLPNARGLKNAIPSISGAPAIILPPQGEQQNYSISVINVPVADVLFKLASNAGKSLVIDKSVKGTVTANLIQQPLDLILKTLTDQVGATYTVTANNITVKPNLPYWETYHINYVNMKKTSTGTISLNMSVGNGTDASSGNVGSSVSNMTTSTESDFWGALKRNLLSLSYVKQIGSGNSTTENSTSQTTSDNNTAATSPSDSTSGASSDASTGSGFSRVVIDRESGLVSVFTLAKNHKIIQAYLHDALKRSNKQVLIEATVVEVELSDQYQAGVDWKAISGNTTVNQTTTGTHFSGSNGQFNISVGTPSFTNFSLTALQQFGDTKVLSSPRIMAVSNQTALLKVVDNEVYFTVKVDVSTGTGGSGNTVTYDTTVHTVPVGFMMSMTPFVTDSDEISINIRPTLSRVVGYALDPNPDLKKQGIESKIPIIQEREMSSVLTLRNKQTAIIGGLIQDSHANNRSGIPGMSDLPAVGDLFAYRDDKVKKNELLIFIRPVIVNNPDVNFGDLQAYKPFLKTKTTNTE